MALALTWINVLILFGALQGLIFCILLFCNNKHPGARFLGVFMFVFAYNGLETFNWSAHLDQYIVFFDLFPFVVIFAVGPSLYLYIRVLLYPEKSISTKQILIHYSPVIFQFLFRFVIVVLYFLANYKITKDNAVFLHLYAFYHLYAEPLSVMVFLIYLYLSVYTYRKVRIALPQRSASKDDQQMVMKWIRSLLVCMVVLGIGWSLTVLIPYVLTVPWDIHYYPIELALVFFVYWIAFAGYHQTKIIYRRVPKAMVNVLSPSDAGPYLALLLRAMETERLYLDPSLNLSSVARHTGVNAKTISAVINQHCGRSFNDFINDYRIRAVQEKLLDPKSQHLTISGIALECGFNSQATFQRAFKNNTGMSPRAFIAQQLQKTG